jgi:hypothetical protein
MQLIRDHVLAPGKPPAVLLAHSIGSYMTLQVLLTNALVAYHRGITQMLVVLEFLEAYRIASYWHRMAWAALDRTVALVGACTCLFDWVRCQ